MAAKVDEKMSDLAETWKEANSRVDTRRENLHSGLQFHQFVHDCKEAWPGCSTSTRGSSPSRRQTPLLKPPPSCRSIKKEKLSSTEESKR